MASFDAPLFNLLIFAGGVICGVFLARRWLLLRQRRTSRKVSAEYYKGLNYILNERPEKALQAFINLVEVQPETIEIHVALGTLYRRRGQLDNAIRIHQNLLARQDLSLRHKALAMFELAEDYRAAGVLDRAEQLLQEVCASGFFNARAYAGLVQIYVAEREWQQAISAALAHANKAQIDNNLQIANFYAELAQQQLHAHNYPAARKFLKQALKAHNSNARVHWLIADIASAQQLPYRAARAYCLLLQHAPRYGRDIIPKIMALQSQLGPRQRQLITNKLTDLYSQEPKLLAAALSDVPRAQLGIRAARHHLAELLQQAPSLPLYQAWLRQYPLSVPSQAAQQGISKILDNIPSHKCDNCGYQASKLNWQCPSCKRWATIFPNTL